MVSEKQVEANRKNSQLSTGPITAQEKEIVAQNATKHGVLSVKVPIDGAERKEFELFASTIEHALQPVNAFELLLVDRIISCAWRLRRVVHVESMLLASQIKMSWSNGTYQEIFSGSSGQTMAIMSRYERTLEYGLYRALKELKEAQTAE